jgi:AAA+ superfamily predicted ATPase
MVRVCWIKGVIPSMTTAAPSLLAEHLQPLRRRLELFDHLLRMAVTRARAVGFQPGEYQGLYVDDQEVERHLTSAPGSGLWEMPESPFDVVAFRRQYITARDTLYVEDQRQQSTFGRLIEAFGLTAVECDLLMVALVPELDRRYERLYSYLQDDVTRRRPTVDFALSLLADNFEDRAELMRLISPGSPLFDYDLISNQTDASQREPTQISYFLKADPRIVQELLGIPAIDLRIAPAVDLYDYSREPITMLSDEALDKLHAAISANPVFYFYGTYGAGMHEAAALVSRNIGAELVRVDLARIKAMISGGDQLEKLIRLSLRESRLRGCPILLDGWINLLDDRHNAPRGLLELILAHPCPVFLVGAESWEAHAIARDRAILRMEFPTPEYEDRVSYWKTYLGEADTDPAEVANKFKLTGGQIRDAVQTARDLAAWRGEAHPNLKDLYAGARAQSNRKLSNLAQKIDPRYGWDDIILPEDNLQQLHEIASQVAYAQRVYGDWGFRGRAKNVHGITALFAGDSGTGKTMSADVIGHELGLDLYRIDLSTVVSKYIGETEKNLGAIFDEASQSNAILFFDEADSLFGKRSEVKDSHDRYANIETGYLLQRMETYSGVAILATNRLQDLDKAFIRRLDFVITFPTAEKSDRARIWKVTFPKNAPLAPDVDFEELAKRYRLLAGGNIRNVVTTSAFAAAADGSPVITLRHIEHAVKREYQKMSKLVE